MNYILPPTTYPVQKNKISPALPEFELPNGFENKNAYLEYLVFKGARVMYGSTIPNNVANRLKFELDVVREKDYADYFLIIADLVRAAREEFNLYVGPGRGSSASSLICYCLGITKIDPLQYDLLFEQLVRLDKNILPDIDIDCEDGAKDVLTEYLKDKYNEICVANIIYYIRKRDNMTDIFGYGVHCSGIALSKEPLSYYTPLTKVDNKVVTVYDGFRIEDAGPVKIDVLECDYLKSIHQILDLIKDKKHIDIDLDNIPTDDICTLGAFSRNETKGISLLSLPQLNKYIMSIKNLSFDDLLALVSLNNPYSKDLIPEFIARKNGDVQTTYLIPIMGKYLNTTCGMMIYHEQFMLLIRAIANFTREESYEIRKAVCMRKTDKIAIFHEMFIDRGKNKGYSTDILEEIWNSKSPFLVGKSHYVCYTMIAYQMMYLKVHYPDEFFEVL